MTASCEPSVASWPADSLNDELVPRNQRCQGAGQRRRRGVHDAGIVKSYGTEIGQEHDQVLDDRNAAHLLGLDQGLVELGARNKLREHDRQVLCVHLRRLRRFLELEQETEHKH